MLAGVWRSLILSRKRTRNSLRSGIRRATRGSRRRMCGPTVTRKCGGAAPKGTTGWWRSTSARRATTVAHIAPGRGRLPKIRLRPDFRRSRRNGIQRRIYSGQQTFALEATVESFGSARRNTSGTLQCPDVRAEAVARSVLATNELAKHHSAQSSRSLPPSGTKQKMVPLRLLILGRTARSWSGGSARQSQGTSGGRRYGLERQIRRWDAVDALERGVKTSVTPERWPSPIRHSLRNGTLNAMRRLLLLR